MTKILQDTLIGLTLGSLLFVLGSVSLPVAGGLWYIGCGERFVEQEWLDRAISHLKLLRANCPDPDLQGVLDHTITRYNKIGAWDVMVMPLANPKPGWKTIGCNCPLVPGVTLDPEVLSYDLHDGSMVLVHEALHDYWPYLGHSQVTPRIDKLNALWAGRWKWLVR